MGASIDYYYHFTLDPSAGCMQKGKKKDKSSRLERKVDGQVFEWVDFFGNGSSVSPKPNTAMNLE